MPNFDLFLNITIKILIAILLVVGIYVSIQFSNKRLENGEKIKFNNNCTMTLYNIALLLILINSLIYLTAKTF